MPQSIQTIFHTAVLQIAIAAVLIAIAVCGLAWLRLNGK
jgi:hypothetical protein